MLQFIKRAAASVTNAATGKLKIFVDSADDLVKTKDETGLLRVFGDGIANIALISTVGRVNTYRITRQSGVTFDYTTTDGLDGTGQPATNNPSSIDPDDAAAIGSVTGRYALEDHQHAIVAAAPTANLTSATTNAEGTATSFARSDHSHAISTATAIQIVAGATAGAGNSAELARANHVHSVSTATPVALGSTASEGTATSLSRSDHVHVNPVIDHEAAADPHPQYTTAAEASAAAPVQSVNGQTGIVNIPTANPSVTNTARSGAITTTVTTAASYSVAANSVAAGHQYRFSALLLVTNTTAASNLVATVAVGATAVATLTQALGTTARTSQPALVEGLIHFQSAIAADGFVRAFASTAVAFDAVAGTGATSVTVTTNANTDVNIKLNTSAATSTVIVQSVSIERIK